jgi:glyoxylase-like metal-dependent hydrolase (beta-lactamase superfamily II)
MLVFKFSFGPLQTNAILLACSKTKKCVAIDSSPGSSSSVLNQIAKLELSLEKILLTHSHWDHFADAHILKEKTGVPLYVHELDAPNLITPGIDRIPLFSPIQPVTPDVFLQEGDAISVGELKLVVIHTPGHSPGGVCFYLPEQNILFSGDTLFKGTMGALHLPTAQPTQMWLSLSKLAKLPSCTRVVPGHGQDTSIGEESWLSRAKEMFSEN